MDDARIPMRLLVDTGVLIRALEHDSEVHRVDPRTQDCRDLLTTLASLWLLTPSSGSNRGELPSGAGRPGSEGRPRSPWRS